MRQALGAPLTTKRYSASKPPSISDPWALRSILLSEIKAATGWTAKKKQTGRHNREGKVPGTSTNTVVGPFSEAFPPASNVVRVFGGPQTLEQVEAAHPSIPSRNHFCRHHPSFCFLIFPVSLPFLFLTLLALLAPVPVSSFPVSRHLPRKLPCPRPLPRPRMLAHRPSESGACDCALQRY